MNNPRYPTITVDTSEGAPTPLQQMITAFLALDSVTKHNWVMAILFSKDMSVFKAGHKIVDHVINDVSQAGEPIPAQIHAMIAILTAFEPYHQRIEQDAKSNPNWLEETGVTVESARALRDQAAGRKAPTDSGKWIDVPFASPKSPDLPPNAFDNIDWTKSVDKPAPWTPQRYDIIEEVCRRTGFELYGRANSSHGYYFVIIPSEMILDTQIMPANIQAFLNYMQYYVPGTKNQEVNTNEAENWYPLAVSSNVADALQRLSDKLKRFTIGNMCALTYYAAETYEERRRRGLVLPQIETEGAPELINEWLTQHALEGKGMPHIFRKEQDDNAAP